jgi:hypothetical protein
MYMTNELSFYGFMFLCQLEPQVLTQKSMGEMFENLKNQPLTYLNSVCTGMFTGWFVYKDWKYKMVTAIQHMSINNLSL